MTFRPEESKEAAEKQVDELEEGQWHQQRQKELSLNPATGKKNLSSIDRASTFFRDLVRPARDSRSIKALLTNKPVAGRSVGRNLLLLHFGVFRV